MSRLKKAISDPAKALAYLREKLVFRYVTMYNLIRAPASRGELPAIEEDFREILAFANQASDISDHLPTLYAEALRMRPRMIVELGVRHGSSTFVFERVAKRFDSALVSVDVEDCSKNSEFPGWRFVHDDDVAFARRFESWCFDNGLPAQIDVLFVDTSHEYEHSVREIETWFGHLAANALVFFHDTNMKEIFVRADGSLGHGWDNDRGVIRAVEEYLGCKLDESRDFTWKVEGWVVRHHAHCSGLTMLERITESR